ncbi:uncharacterized protein LOC110945091 [Helianthus annuus]|uniref:uncharacterized protein LOC110945091 n=1 Tax=Helianthus annuus TaxID=4232 RepID=UPI000B8F5412|nr:uncharacterized protein LOC110945091 [Helianthus annuus]
MSKAKQSGGESPSLSLSFIDDLNPAKDMWNIKCRIIQKWSQSFWMDLILLDEKYLISQLHEDEIVILSRFGVGENMDPYKVVNHDYNINFYRCTVVTCANGWQGVDYGFNFMAHSDIVKGEGNNLLTVDVAGTVVWCGDMDIFGKPPKERKRMNLDLQDVLMRRLRSDRTLVMNCWICILLRAGQYTVQNDKFGTRMFLNQEIDEVNELRRSLLVKQFKASGSSSQTILPSQSVFPVRQEFLIETTKRHVDEIIEIESVMSCVVVATIKIVQENYGWFYPACRNCNKKVLTKTEYLQFKVHLRVQDETGSVSFVMFDKDLTKIIGSTASDIRERQVKVNDTEICDDPNIIAELVADNGNALEVADEVSQEGSEFKAVQLSESSQMAGGAFSKDVVFVTADSSVVKAEKDSGTSPNGKRSVQEVEGQNVGELSSNNKKNRKKSSRLNT